MLRVSGEALQTYLTNSATLEKRIYTYDEDSNTTQADLDKSWDGILYLLTGHSLSNTGHPLMRVLFSTQFIDDEQDLGYGPAHYLEPDEVAELNRQIADIQTADLKQRFNPQSMTEQDIYPGIWDEGDEAFEYLAGHFKALQHFYAEAAANQQAIITWLS